MRILTFFNREDWFASYSNLFQPRVGIQDIWFDKKRVSRQFSMNSKEWFSPHLETSHYLQSWLNKWYWWNLFFKREILRVLVLPIFVIYYSILLQVVCILYLVKIGSFITLKALESTIVILFIISFVRRFLFKVTFTAIIVIFIV